MRTDLQGKGLTSRPARQHGKWGYALLWLLGIPLPILLVVYLLRGCS